MAFKIWGFLILMVVFSQFDPLPSSARLLQVLKQEDNGGGGKDKLLKIALPRELSSSVSTMSIQEVMNSKKEQISVVTRRGGGVGGGRGGVGGRGGGGGKSGGSKGRFPFAGGAAAGAGAAVAAHHHHHNGGCVNSSILSSYLLFATPLLSIIFLRH